MSQQDAARRSFPGRRRTLSRRRFLSLSASAVAAVSATALVGCGEPQPAPSPSPGPSPTPSLQPPTTRGGTLRALNFDAMALDTLDPHLTQLGPVVNMHSAVFSRLLQYEDERSLTLVPDLAEALPEQPDELTYVVRLRRGVKFHDHPRYRDVFPAVAGRELNAEDVKSSIERQQDRNGKYASRWFRQSDWSVIDSMEVRDPHTLVFKLKTPTAPFLNFLAGRHAFIMPRDIAALGHEANNLEAMIGTGPFILEAFESQKLVRLLRNPEWFARDDESGAGTGRPFLDGYEAPYTPQEDLFEKVLFERRELDVAQFIDVDMLAQEHTTNLSDIALEETDAGGMLVSRLLLDRPPFSDARVRRALHLALDRRSLASLLYPDLDGQPSARLTAAVAPVMGEWATAPESLQTRPGYRSERAARDEDIAQARQLWSAAFGGDGPAAIGMMVAGVPRSLPEQALPAIQRQLKEGLGIDVWPQVDVSGQAFIAAAYVRNLEGTTEGTVTCTLALEDGGVDIDDWLYPHFRSGGSMNTYRLQDAQLDSMLDQSRAEFDNDARRQLGLDIQDYLLTQVNARLEYFAPVRRRIVWGYVRNSKLPIWYGANQYLADVWIDTNHASWRAPKADAPASPTPE